MTQQKQQKDPLFSCQNLKLSYGNQIALRGIDFEIQEGDYLCIVGSNGSGKSTLLKGILGLIEPTGGTLHWREDIKPGTVGYLPQQTMQQKDFPATVWEVVQSGCLAKKGRRPFFQQQELRLVEDNLKRLDIWSLRKKSYRNLSGGQQQRVLLARALCATEKLLFMDEPITGLDPTVTKEFYSLLFQLNQEDGLTIVMTSHDLSTALQYANKILQLDHEVVFFGDLADYKKSQAFFHLAGGEQFGAAARDFSI